MLGSLINIWYNCAKKSKFTSASCGLASLHASIESIYVTRKNKLRFEVDEDSPFELIEQLHIYMLIESRTEIVNPKM